MPSEAFQKLVARMAANPLTQLPVDEMRAQMDTFGQRAELPPGLTSAPDDADGVAGILLTPQKTRSGLILYAHGGGFTLGSSTSHVHVAAWLAEYAGVQAFIFDYRLAPEHPYPAALDDCSRVYDWAISAHDPASVAVAGDSAGANLWLASAGRDPAVRPAAIAALSPSLDLAGYLDLDPQQITDKTVDARSIAAGFRDYAGDSRPDDPGISPARLSGESLRGFPPTLLQYGEGEIFAPGNDAFARNARDAGVPIEVDIWPDMIHDWHWFAPRLPEAAEALNRAGAFLSAHLA